MGAGYIGVEMAEAMVTRGLETTIIDQAPEPFTQVDPDMGALIHEAMEGMGITVLTGVSVDGFDVGEDGRVARGARRRHRAARRHRDHRSRA